MDLGKWEHFRKLVSKIVKSGDAELNEVQFKEVKSICKSGLVPISDVFDLVLKYLKTKHCQVRISSFQILDELFLRSHEFRDITLENLRVIVSLTLALETTEELPHPQKYQKILKKTAIKAIDNWNEKFGKHYHKLRVSYDFLRTKKNVDFKELITRSDFEQQQEEKRRESERKVAEYQVAKILSHFDENLDSFNDCVFELNSCINLLSQEASKYLAKIVLSGTSNNLGEHGAEVLEIREGSDNSSIIQVLDDLIHQARKSFIPKLDAWIQDLIKNDGKKNDILPFIKMKEKLSVSCDKYDLLKITRNSKRKRRIVQKEVGESDESDFDEVDEEKVLSEIGEEKHISLAMELTKPKGKEKLVKSVTQDSEAPCSSTSLQNPAEDSLNKPRSGNRMISVLKDEQDENDESELNQRQLAHARLQSIDRFGFMAAKDREPEELDIDTVRALNPSYCNVPGIFDPVKWSCRARLKSGKLCPRMDRQKCPLHGKVIPRDKEGNPNSDRGLFTGSDSVVASSSRGDTWEELQKEIESVIGPRLKHDKSKKRKTREIKPTNLVSLSKQPSSMNTPRARLEKKILNKKSIRSVNKNAAQLETKRNESAHSQQFNYAMSENPY